MLKTIGNVLKYLDSNFTIKGLYDPIEKQILPNKYGNSFFALSSLLYYELNQEEKWKRIAELATAIELENTKNRFHKIEMFRWEFKNYALLKIYQSNQLNPTLQKKLKKRILNMQNLGSFKTNWMAMRGLNLLLRGHLLNSRKDKTNSKKEIKKVLQRQTKEGLFYDDYNSDSFQYHCFILAQLVQYYEISPTEHLKKRILKGLILLTKITDPQGDCCYFGRGQQQIFGYAAAIYALSYAHTKMDDTKEFANYAKLIFTYIKPYINQNKIIANNNEKEKAGWYRYNYITDYLPFAATYLLLANKHIDLDTTKFPTKKEYELFLDNSNLFIKKTKEYFICICAGNKESSELPGIVNIFPRNITCSGGPHINIYGKEPYTQNYLGIGKTNFLAKKTGTLLRKEDGVKLIFNLKKMYIMFSFFLKKDIFLSIKILPKGTITMHPLHYVSSKPLDNSMCIGQILTPEGIANEYLSEPITSNKLIKKKLLLYKGKEYPTEIRTKEGKKEKRKKRTEQKIIHFLTLFTTKAIYHPKDMLYSLFYLYIRNNYKRKKVKF
jgi:hypothetical protein